MENLNEQAEIENIYDFVPSLLNPRAVRLSDQNLSQLSTTSRFSLSLKKRPRTALQDISPTQNKSVKKSETAKTIANSQNKYNSKIVMQTLDECNKNGLESNKAACKEPTNDHSEMMLNNVEKCSTHSLSTELYDPFKDCSSVPNSLASTGPSDRFVMNINMLSPSVEIVRKRLSTLEREDLKKKKSDNDLVLILNKTAIKDYSKIIVEPPNVKLIKRNESDVRKSQTLNLQPKITSYFQKAEKREGLDSESVASDDDCVFVCQEKEVKKIELENLRHGDRLGKSRNVAKNTDIKLQKASSTKGVHSAGSVAFSIPLKSTSKPNSPTPLPPHKIIPGTQFAVDAFCYGSLPNVTAYFLTHFHSDHYMGLRKSFNSRIYCSKITGDLCMLKLGVNPKCINIINPGERLVVDGVQVNALDANHCPGAIMLVFTLRTGANILHCGDFRATHSMESLPIFWNKDIHTVYLDTTYCNPRYDFPTQDESIEMALSILQRKKLDLKKKNKDFARVLIVCGTYTIGKEKFFQRVSERLECCVWATAEKDLILRTVLGRSFAQKQAQRCQLHVLDMRLLNYRDLKTHLENMNGAFSEIVAFKPSGWESTNKPPFQCDNVTIHGIPYSEHSSFSEMLRFINFLRPKLVVPTVPISGGIKTVQKYFPCPLALKDDVSQKKISDFFVSNKRSVTPAIT